MIKLGSHVMIKGADFKNWRGVVEKIDFHSCSVKFPNFLPRWYFESEVMEIADFKEGDLVRITDCGRRIKPEFAIKLVGCEGRIYSISSDHLIGKGPSKIIASAIASMKSRMSCSHRRSIIGKPSLLRIS
jgi:hypothetical protein